MKDIIEEYVMDNFASMHATKDNLRRITKTIKRDMAFLDDVVCDERNNTDVTVESNMVVIDLYYNNIVCRVTVDPMLSHKKIILEEK